MICILEMELFSYSHPLVEVYMKKALLYMELQDTAVFVNKVRQEPTQLS